MNRKWIAAILIYLGLIAVCCIALYAVPSVRGMLERTYIAEYGTIDVADEVSAFIVRDETVYVAAQPSRINRIAEADKLVKAKTKVAELTLDQEGLAAEIAAEEAKEKALGGAGKKMTEEEAAEAAAEAELQAAEAAAEAEAEAGNEESSGDGSGSKEKDEEKSDGEENADDGTEADEDDGLQETDTGKYTKIMEELGDAVVSTEEGYNNGAGYVSYYVDGAEAKLSTKALDDLDYEDFKALTGRRAIETPDKKCGTGYPVFKIVRNSKWYLVYYLSNKAAEKYTPGDTVTMDINGDPVDVTVSQVLPGNKSTRITLSCKSFFDGFLEERNLDTTVTVVSAQGLVLEDQSIIEAPDGRRGVFVKNKLGEHVFKPVRAKADDGKKCVVYSDIYVDDEGNFVETIATYDEIIAVPSEADIESLTKKPEEPAEEAPAEQPQEEAPAEQPAETAPAEAAPAEQPAEAAPAEQPAETAPAEAAPADQPAEAAPAEQPAEQAAEQPAA